jgi:hypothetical protein
MRGGTFLLIDSQVEERLCWKGMQIVTMKIGRSIENSEEITNAKCQQLSRADEIWSFNPSQEVKVNPTVNI